MKNTIIFIIFINFFILSFINATTLGESDIVGVTINIPKSINISSGNADGNASSICNPIGGDTFLLGNGSCMNFSDVSGGTNTQKTTNNFYLYNDSSIIYFNETQLNDTIDARAGGDNESWNQSFANTLYLLTGENWSLSDLNTLFNNTQWWNKTYADTLYADISVTDTTIENASACGDNEYLDGNGACTAISLLNQTSLVESVNTTNVLQLLLNATNMFFGILNSSQLCLNDDCISTWSSVNSSASDTNETSRILNLTSSTCGTGQAIGVQANGSLTCIEDSSYNATYALYNDTALVESVNTTISIQNLINNTNLNLAGLNISSGNITQNIGSFHCLNAECTQWIMANATGVFIQG